MSELFLELFSEEIPAKLQIKAREQLKEILKKFFEENSVKLKNEPKVFSTPNRIAIKIENLPKDILYKASEKKGPSVLAPEKALDGFLKSNNLSKNKIYKKKTDKGEFYFYKIPKKKIKLSDLLKKNFESLLLSISWQKSMKWGENNLYWGRPLKSILAVLDGKKLQFSFIKLNCSFFPSNTAKMDFNGLPQYRLFSPHFIDFCQLMLSNRLSKFFFNKSESFIFFLGIL